MGRHRGMFIFCRWLIGVQARIGKVRKIMSIRTVAGIQRVRSGRFLRDRFSTKTNVALLVWFHQNTIQAATNPPQSTITAPSVVAKPRWLPVLESITAP